MTLGKGLSSLIPKKNDNQQPPQEEDFATSKINQTTISQDEKPAALLEKNDYVEENFSSPKPTSKEQADIFLGGEKRNLAPKKSVSEAERARFPAESRKSEAESQGASASLGRETPSFRGARLSARKISDSEHIFHIEVEKIKSNPHQPRRDFNEESLKELAMSIREFGILQPLVVSKIEKETESGTEVEYQLIAGERRLMAAKMLGWERAPAIVKKVSQKSEQLEMAVVENLQRANLNPIETARAYSKLQDEFGLTQREIGGRLGKSRETIANTLRLLSLPTEIQDVLAKNQINESQARLLLIIEDLTEQQKLFQELLAHNLSVRELRQRIKKADGQGSIVNGQKSITVDPEIISLQEQLAELLGAQVKIEKTDKSGKIIITFYSSEEIQGIVNKLKTNN